MGKQMDKELELRIKNWLAVNMTQRADILEAAGRAGAVSMRAESFVEVGEILRDALKSSTQEAITEQNFQAAQSVIVEGDL
jgi:energy-converting hydrogenase A subunit M